MEKIPDKALALLGLCCLFPLMALISLLIRMEDGHSVFFVQYRLGKYKRPFLIYKFRTMHDGKVTRIGRVLRKTGLDELPQLLNILRGEMQIVGPRPLTYADITRLGWDRRCYVSRWHASPGITGLAQLHAGQSARYSWMCDRVYLAQASLWLDLKIILTSLLMLLLGKRRVRTWIRQLKPEQVMPSSKLTRSPTRQSAQLIHAGPKQDKPG